MSALDHLDQLVEDYLALLDEYRSLHARLELDLKRGHLNLAKAKLALGPTRVSSNSWDLQEQQSVVEISIENRLDRKQPLALDAGDNPRAAASHLQWSVRPRVAQTVAQAPPNTTAASSLRQRNNTKLTTSREGETTLEARGTVTGSAASGEKAPTTTRSARKDDDDDGENAAVRPPPRSPLAQFSALPPPALRDASSHFERGLVDMVHIVEVERQLRDLAREIKAVKKKIRRGEQGEVEREVE
ncbi:hypothetical protein JCM3766R1_000469 [Sporobolomyces carnicolor]